MCYGTVKLQLLIPLLHHSLRTLIDVSQKIEHYPLDSYWRFPNSYDYHMTSRLREELENRGYKYGGRKKRLVYLLRRIDDNLFLYDQCSLAELQRFAEDRCIQLSEGTSSAIRAQHKLLVSALELADEAPRFEELLLLPPELRNTVYGYYVADFLDRPLHAPAMPPLTRASRQSKKEVLPVFFSSCIFDVHLIEMQHWSDKTWHLYTSSHTRCFFDVITADNLACVRMLRACVREYGDQSMAPDAACLFTINGDGRGFKVACSGTLTGIAAEHFQARLRDIEQTVRKVMLRMQLRSNGGDRIVLRKEDVVALGWALTLGYQGRGILDII
ncbi:hypothetical protein LTR85_006756 [Meristemomyces frigidus]|nr:hypothetical protein LTR85_006756 [Meristemomyces frigidus]